MPDFRFELEPALRRLPTPEGARSTTLFKHGSMTLKVYAPRGADAQKPHTQDEIYVVVSGHGKFRVDDKTAQFRPGDTLFVSAGAVHRFEEFTDDLVVWVVFWGPEGGEAIRR
jgi:mannose-6-phosphate isomerase-like protein (cupin superfamily)